MAKWGQIKLKESIDYDDLRHIILFLERNVGLKDHVEYRHSRVNSDDISAYNDMIVEYRGYISKLKEIGVTFN